MIDKINEDQERFWFKSLLCKENGISAEIDDKIQDEDYIVLKIDKYYASLKMAETPPSPDCLIIVKCKKNNLYDLYLVELKNIKSPAGFKVNNIKAKFKTAVKDFMCERFKDILLNKSYSINKFKIYFVTDACRIKKYHPDITEEDYLKRIETTKLKRVQNLKPLKFRNKSAAIDSRLPNPMIKYC
ncbi:MAG: hypothetical protein JRJ49_00175 [Deltaproteobacteria bacterium]|nr:hypothetical protein [Deltaproteobacteria bacterium]